MHDADEGHVAAPPKRTPVPDHHGGRVNRYASSRLAGEVLTRAARSRAYCADRAEEQERPTRSSAYLLLFFAVVVAVCAYLIVAAF